jgi:exonuclease III
MRTEGDMVLHLPSWNANGVRSRKLELEYFLNQHGVDIFLLSETFLKPGQAFRLAIYGYHRKDRLKWGEAVQPSWNAVV